MSKLTPRQARREELAQMRAVKADPRLAYVKGETSCNREACQAPLPSGQRWWNSSTQAFYCKVCAMHINDGLERGTPDICTLSNDLYLS